MQYNVDIWMLSGTVTHQVLYFLMMTCALCLGIAVSATRDAEPGAKHRSEWKHGRPSHGSQRQQIRLRHSSGITQQVYSHKMAQIKPESQSRRSRAGLERQKTRRRCECCPSIDISEAFHSFCQLDFL